MVSIVMPTYNGARKGAPYMQEAIQSCIDQTYLDWELIIVDDASTDNTPEIIARFVEADARIRSVRLGKNSKTPTALNTGFAVAKGDLLTWIADDNTYRPTALQEMSAFLTQHTDADLVYADYTHVEPDGKPISLQTVGPTELLVDNCNVGVCFLYRRAVHEALKGYRPEYYLTEDYDFWLRASNRFNLQPLHRDLATNRRHPGMQTIVHVEKSLLLVDRLMEEVLPTLGWVSRRKRAEVYNRLAKSALDRGRMADARRHILRSLWYSPGLVFSHGKRPLVTAILGSRLARRLFGYAPHRSADQEPASSSH